MHTVVRGESLSSRGQKVPREHGSHPAGQPASGEEEAYLPGRSWSYRWGPPLPTRPCTPRKGGAGTGAHAFTRCARATPWRRVARKTGVPVEDLRKINKLDSDSLRPGQRLVLEASRPQTERAATAAARSRPRPSPLPQLAEKRNPRFITSRLATPCGTSRESTASPWISSAGPTGSRRATSSTPAIPSSSLKGKSGSGEPRREQGAGSGEQGAEKTVPRLAPLS